MRRYLLFARQFKPKIIKASADYMVEEYKRLRQRDSSGDCVCVLWKFVNYSFAVN